MVSSHLIQVVCAHSYMLLWTILCCTLHMHWCMYRINLIIQCIHSLNIHIAQLLATSNTSNIGPNPMLLGSLQTSIQFCTQKPSVQNCRTYINTKHTSMTNMLSALYLYLLRGCSPSKDVGCGSYNSIMQFHILLLLISANKNQSLTINCICSLHITLHCHYYNFAIFVHVQVCLFPRM